MNQPLELVERLASLLLADLRRAAAAHGLRGVHAQVLRYLAASNRLSATPTAVGDYLGLTRGTVSQTLRLLEDRGLLTRRRDGADRRTIRLELTAAGAAAAEAVGPTGAWRGQALPPGGEAGLRGVLIELQRHRAARSFGSCRTCRHLRGQAGGAGEVHCAITGEEVPAGEAARICREHEPVPRPSSDGWRAW